VQEDRSDAIRSRFVLEIEFEAGFPAQTPRTIIFHSTVGAVMNTQEITPDAVPRTQRPENPSSPAPVPDSGASTAADEAPETPAHHGDGASRTAPPLRSSPPSSAPSEAGAGRKEGNGRLKTPPRHRPWKKPEKELRNRYGLHLQIGFVLALALIWGLTFVNLEIDDGYNVELGEQEVVQMEEVKQTEQEVAPPAPPRPAAPVEVANDAIVDETRELNFDASLDLNEELTVGGPPEETPPPQEEEEPEQEIFVVVEDSPELVGGLASLQQNVEYPEMARKAGIEGRVIVQFIVDENGDVTSPTVVRGRHPLLDQEALRVIRLAKFEPGRQRGEPVKVQMALPITFVLSNSD
jgi:protein TonB